MNKGGLLDLINELELKLQELKTKVENAEPLVRCFEKPPYDSDNWVMCCVCGAYSDVDPCDICCQEGYADI